MPGPKPPSDPRSDKDSGRPSTFTVYVKVEKTPGKLERIAVGKIHRAKSGVTIEKINAPSLHAMVDDFISSWKAFEPPKTIQIVEEIYSDSGMRPTKERHAFDFSPGDKLYHAAVLRHFVEKHGYQALGLSSIEFVESDREQSRAKRGEIIHDEPLRNFNHRKGEKLSYSTSGYVHFFVSKKIRKANNGTPSGVLRVSASKPSLAVSQDHDDGELQVAHLKLHKSGKFELTPSYPGAHLVQEFGHIEKFDRDVEVSVIENAEDYKRLTVKRDSPLFLEAYITQRLEHSKFYEIEPKIDPAIFL